MYEYTADKNWFAYYFHYFKTVHSDSAPAVLQAQCSKYGKHASLQFLILIKIGISMLN